jgi:hypothetical protein
MTHNLFLLHNFVDSHILKMPRRRSVLLFPMAEELEELFLFLQIYPPLQGLMILPSF